MLTPKKQLFVEYYLVNSNATEAAKKAGYSEKTAKSQGARLLTDVDIRKLVERRLTKVAMTADEWMTEVAELARKAEKDSDRLTAYGLIGKPLNLTNSNKLELNINVADLTDEELEAIAAGKG